MPIHQTKLVMSNAHPTGTLLPQMPIPVNTRLVSETRSSPVRSSATPKPAYHHIGVRRARTIELILSVTVPKVCPGAITGGVAADDGAADHRPTAADVFGHVTSPSSGLTLRTAARYVVRGRVFSSPSSE